MATVFRFIHYIDSFFKSLVFRCQKCCFSLPKCTIWLSMDISFCFCFPLSVSLYGIQHLSAAAGLSVAAIGTAGLSHHTLTPLLLVFSPSHSVSLSLSSALPLPLCMCLVSCVLQWCHYWAAQITLPPMSCLSALPLSLATLLFSLSFSLSILLLVRCLWRLYITFIPETRCPSQMLPIIPCMADTLSPSPVACPHQQPEWCVKSAPHGTA